MGRITIEIQTKLSPEYYERLEDDLAEVLENMDIDGTLECDVTHNSVSFSAFNRRAHCLLSK